MRQSVDYFQELLSSWGDSYTREYVTWLSLVDREGAAHLVYAFRFFTYKDLPVETFEVATTSLVAGRTAIFHKDGLSPEVALSLTVTPYKFGDKLYEFSKNLSSPTSRLDSHFDPIGPIRMRGPTRLPCLTFKHNVERMPPFYEDWEIDQSLVGATTPFADLSDLLQFLNLPIQASQCKYTQQVEIVLMPPARFVDRPFLRNGGFSGDVQTYPALDLSELAVAVRAERKGMPLLRDRLADPGSIENNHSMQVYRYSGSFPEAISATLFLTYKGRLCETITVRDLSKFQNERVQLHKLIDDAETLESTLLSKQGHELESAVAVYLGILGFTVLPYGGIKAYEEKAPDLIALSPDNYLFLIECTSGDIDHKGKLFKLSTRFKEITETLHDAGMSFNGSLAVIMTNLNKEQTAAHSAKLENFRIALVANEDIRHFMTSLDGKMSGRQLYEAGTNLIPKVMPNMPE